MADIKILKIKDNKRNIEFFFDFIISLKRFEKSLNLL